MVTKINEYSVVKAMVAYDKWGGDPERCFEDWIWAKRVAVAHPTEYRNAKSSIMNEIDDRDDMDDNTAKIYDRLATMRDKYGRDSMIFNTLVRAISIAQYEVKQVNEMRLRDRSTPPAFDKSKRAVKTMSRQKLRKELESYVLNSHDRFMDDLRVKFSKELNKLNRIVDRRSVVLTNGTTTALEWMGYNINDITSVIYIPEDLENNEHLNRLARFLGILNNTSELLYIKIPKCERFSTAGGDHMEIPDKDGKIREVYRMYPWIQTVAKAFHQFLDKIARDLEGNYTYKHREWMHRLVKENWNNTKYIIGTDMTKYSDTLDRSFILFILEAMGIPKKVIDSIDYLYGQDIFDPLLSVFYRNTDATFQGEYGDFPMITIANLILQSFVYYKVGQPKCDGYNAAVGDDTGMVFDKYDDSIMETIIEIYGSVGVRINSSKTGELKYGHGRIDFVKLELTGQKIIPFLNMRSVCNNNLDSLIRDIFELESTNKDQKFELFQNIFGLKEAERLMDLSIINGGMNDRPITEKDLNFYVSRTQKLHRLMGYEPDETRRILDEQSRYLHDVMDWEPHYLVETAYIGYLDVSEEQIQKMSLKQMDERIKLNILNMMKLGLNKGTYKNYFNWLGKIPSELRNEWLKRDSDPTKLQEYSDIWDEVTSYETFAAKRKREQSKMSRKISTMLPILNGMYDNINTMGIPDSAYYQDLELKTVQDYERDIIPYKALENKAIISKLLSSVCKFTCEPHFGIKYHYVYTNYKGSYTKFRMYEVYYSSIYDLLPRDLFDSWKETYLKGTELTYDEMIETWDCAGKIVRDNLPVTDKGGWIL